MAELSDLLTSLNQNWPAMQSSVEMLFSAMIGYGMGKAFRDPKKWAEEADFMSYMLTAFAVYSCMNGGLDQKSFDMGAAFSAQYYSQELHPNSPRNPNYLKSPDVISQHD